MSGAIGLVAFGAVAPWPKWSRHTTSRRPRKTAGTARLGQPFSVAHFLVLRAPPRLVGLGFGELLLRSRFRVVSCRKLARSRVATHGYEGDDNERYGDHRHDDPRDHAWQRTAFSPAGPIACAHRVWRRQGR